MDVTVQTFTVHKKYSLQISRGTTSETTNIWIKLKEDGIEGWGEASPFAINKEKEITTVQLVTELEAIIPQLKQFSPWQRQEIESFCDRVKLSSALKAAIDMALHDWLGKKVGLPLWQMWGLNRDRIVPISVTVGISSPLAAQQRVKAWQEVVDFQVLKVKLGNPAGIEADQAMLLAVKEIAVTAKLTVDANGGWSLTEAISMCRWLATLGVEYVEQPLPVGEEAQLSTLSQSSPLPIFVDESCFTSRDIPQLADSVAGVNLKIMKTGGLTEAMRAIHLAKACNLKVMFGCYSDSSLANTAMSHLAPLADYLDLDSHLNLIDDPFAGATMTEGRLLPNDLPGIGVEYCGSHS
ncbi:Mandelate racemase/muconate lactonizing protein [Stanieria cyanosphaera PCC 7437]|uniref:Dipeptide epimerase n=1 Tax=Stanieria cyanosphaera (strain ATCC 29371 / PCC 7437) TaxID=111780 RepID=K9XR89_STAC7|nr:dipeptide epimerase [Stanieria cyanosphaera]AFZ34589.1 Mandelate racemase/muconate lactonizing protein [Stanieria cyanosphaera PCC 7437]